jgi:hypothetical protein
MTTFEAAFERITGNGWLSRGEAALLWWAAGETAGPILEIGCYKGRSTMLLVQLGRPLMCVDPFAGFSTEDPSGELTYKEWLENTREFANIQLYKVRVECWVPRPAAFAYLDGDHSAVGTRIQIGAAKRAGAKVVAVHDVSNSAGGQIVRDAAVAELGKWHHLVETLAVWRL